MKKRGYRQEIIDKSIKGINFSDRQKSDEACTYCWVLVGLIWVLISRIPSLANLSPLYKHRSRNVISSVENSVVKLMRGCKSLMS